MFCLVCDAVLEFMGKLGNLVWYRCPACGMEQSIPAEDEDELEEILDNYEVV